jgi:hypothetical protein
VSFASLGTSGIACTGGPGTSKRDPRIEFVKLNKERGKQRNADPIVRADRQAPAQQRGVRIRNTLQVLHFGKNARHDFDDFQTRRGWLYRATRTVEDRNAKMPFEARNGLRNGRLGHPKTGGGLRDVP